MEYKNKPCRMGAWVLGDGGWFYTATPEKYAGKEDGNFIPFFILPILPPQPQS